MDLSKDIQIGRIALSLMEVLDEGADPNALPFADRFNAALHGPKGVKINNLLNELIPLLGFDFAIVPIKHQK